MKKKHLLLFGIALTTIIGLNSCATTEEVVKEETEENMVNTTDDRQSIPTKEIAKGNLHGYGAEGIEEGGVIIDSEEEWKALTTKMNSVNPAIQEKSIDFEKSTVLAYFDQIRGSGGFEVKIKYVTKFGKTTEAAISKTSPDGPAIEIMTQPFYIVSIPKTADPVTFITPTE